ncbi:hypothetical protein CKO09_02930 [Chromatium weissei]|nr:hypothetical protein [Chromatium weissei]
MAKLFLEAGDTFTVSDPAEVFGSTGAETLRVNGIGVSANANVDRVEFGGRVADYTFLVEGNVVSVFKADVKVATLGTADTTELAFTDGTADLVITGLNAVTLGGTAVPTGTATAVVPATIDATDKSTIIDPTTPNFTLTGPATAVESGVATYTVNLSAVQAAETSVEIAAVVDAASGAEAADIGALALASGADVTLVGNTLTFAAGATSATITLPVISDTTPETGNKVAVTLANPSSGLALGAAKTVTTTLQDAPAVTYTLTPATDSVKEGTPLKFTLTASSSLPTDQLLTVSIVGNSNGGTATTADLADFTTPPTTVTLPAGATTLDLTLTPAANDGVEGSQGFTVSLLQGAKALATSSVVVISDAITDTTGPVFDTTKIGPFDYAENAVATTVVATVAATDASTPVTYSMTNDNFAIDATTGAITLTAAGLASTLNNFDDTGTTASNTAKLTVTATDAAGNPTTQDVDVNVTNVDDDAPVIATATGSASTLALAFNEALSTTSGVPDKSAFTGTQTISGTVTNLNITGVAINGSAVSLTLGSSIPTGATVKVNYVQPTTAPLIDAAGNKVASITDQAITMDTAGPTLATTTPFSPLDNATDVTAGSNLAITFNEGLKAGTGNITIVNSANATDTRTISVTDTTGQISISGSVLTINPTADLTAGASYYVNIASTALTDALGNAFAGISDVATFNFSVQGSTTTGIPYTLTQGQDTVPGTAGDDTINGFLDGGNVTWSSNDNINGQGGTDTLTILGVSGALDFTQVSNVEKFVIGTGTTAVTADFSKTNAETSLTLQNPTVAVTATNLAMGTSGFDLGITGNDGDADAFSFGFTGTSGTTDTVRLALNNVAGTTGDTITLDTGNGVEILSITGSGAASKPGAFTFGTALNRINVAGNVKVDLSNTALPVGVTTLDASSSEAGVVFKNGVANNLKFTGGKGNDTMDMGTLLTTADTLVGGDGTDTLQVGAALVAADLTNVSGFEVFGAGATLTQDWALVSSKFANHAAINVAATTLTLNNITNGLVVDVNAGVTADNTKVILGGLATSGSADAVTVNLGATNGGLVLTDLQRNADVETLTLNSQGTAANTLSGMTVAMTNLAVTGATALTVTSTGSLAGTLDASAMTAGLTATTATTALTLFGSNTAADTITSGNVTGGATQTLSGKGGDDTITAAAATTAGVTINIDGGAGNDTLTGPGAAAITGVLNGGAGIDIINAGSSTGAGFFIQSNATAVADADIISNFNTGQERFQYTGTVVNGSVTTVAGNVQASAGAATLNADVAAVLAANTSAVVYVVTQNLTGSAATALTNLAGATASTLPSLYTTFEGELVTALAGAISSLDTVLSATDQVLMAFDNGTHSVIVRVQNSDAAGNTLTAAEIELVGVFNGTAALAAADFIGSTGTGNTITSLVAGTAMNVSNTLMTNATAVSTAFADSITGGTAADGDTIDGGAGNDTISGDAGTDSITGGVGNDSMTGGADADTFNVTSTGTTDVDVITDWGNGVDVLADGGATANGQQVNVTITDTSATAFSAATMTAGLGKVSVTGGAANDTISGSAQADTISGGAGNDIITGNAGADSLTGGTGADKFTIGATDSLNTALDVITDFKASGADTLDLVTIPAELNTTADDANADFYSTALSVASTGTTTGTLATDIASGVAAAIVVDADYWDNLGDTILVTLTGASLAGTAVTYVVQNQATDTTYAAAADTVIALTGTSVLPTALADFV